LLFIVILALGFALRLLFISLLTPSSDVFYYDKEAASTLLAGMSPYGHQYLQIPAVLRTPGADRVFAYLPFTAIFLVPFYLVGEVRLAFVTADMIVALAIFSIKGRWSLICSAVYLLVPFTIIFSTFFINNGLIAIAFLSFFALCEIQGKPTLGATGVGLALASIQFTLVAIPFILYHYIRWKRWKEIAVFLGVSSLIISPFLVASPSTFLYDTVWFQFARPSMPIISNAGPFSFNINLTLNSVAQALFGSGIPLIIRLLLVLLILPFFLRKSGTIGKMFLYTGVYILLVIFILPNDFFTAYVELPFVFFLLYKATPEEASIKAMEPKA
jgi:hypothetical protein